MKCYSYTNDISDTLTELHEVTIQADIEELKILSDFIVLCIQRMEKDRGWEHEHFKDYLAHIGSGSKQFCDFVIFRDDNSA